MNRPRISVFIAASIDGYIARENGDLDWLENIPSEEGEDYGYKAFIATVDVILMGRKTYEKVAGFQEWPYTGKRLIVLSDTLEAVKEEAELYSGSIDALLSRLDREGVKHAYVDGGITISKFLEKGIVDHLTLTIIPILLGQGIPLFHSMDRESSLKLESAHSYPNGLVQLRYERK